MRMQELYFRQNLIEERRSEGIMTGLAQEEQKRNSPFTLEATLEEEPKVNNSYINNAIPFDKCIEADKQADEEEKKRRLYSQIETAKATREQSEKEIKEWLGVDTIIKTIFKTTYSSVIAFAISVGTTIWSWKSLQNAPQETYLAILRDRAGILGYLYPR